MDIEEDIIDYEISSYDEISSSSEADDGAETTEVCDFENTHTSPIQPLFPSVKFRKGVDEPNNTNEKENNDNNDKFCSSVSPSGTIANPSKPVFSPKVTINFESLFTEIKTSRNCQLLADETLGSKVNGECYANAPPLPILTMQYPKVSFDASSSFSNRKEDSDSDASEIRSPVLSMHTPKVSYKASSSLSRNAVQIGRTETGMRCSPRVSFNPSSLIFLADPRTASNCLDGTNPYEPTHKVTTRLDPSSLLGSSSISSPYDKQQSLADTTSKNLDACEALSTVSLHNEKNTPGMKILLCTPKVSFNSSSLIFSDDPQMASECLESPNPNAPAQIATNANFDPSSLSISSSDDELQLHPTDDTSKYLDSDQQAISRNPPYNGLVSGGPTGSSGGLRGILKLKKAPSPNEKIVTDCLKLLSETANDEQVHDMIRSSAKDVFKNLCFEHFFQKGECISSSCDDNHQYKSHMLTHGNEELWNASLYVICHAATPNLQVVENLVQHYTAKGRTIRSLLFAKCITKVKDADRLELAHFIVNKLSGTIPPRDIVTVILMLNFATLASLRYNILMEGLGVFEQNTTHYSELMAFLNFHEHKMPIRFLVKLIDDSIKYSGKGSIVESISGFLKRLHPSQKNEIQTAVNRFEGQFRMLQGSDQNEDTKDEEPPQKRSKTGKKKVIFAANPEVREFEVAACPREVQCEVENPVLSDEDCEDDDELDIPNFYGSSEALVDIIERVFGRLCCSLVLHGQCTKNTICDLIHEFGKDSFAGLSSEDLRLAADFIIDQSKQPSFGMLEIFIELLAESLQKPVQMNEIARILKFRKFSQKLSTSESLNLTRKVISVLSKQIGLWDAIEKVLVPIPVELEDPEDGGFLFDDELIHFIMSTANTNKSAILRCVSGAITKHISILLQGSSEQFLQVAKMFVEKFVMTGREVEPLPDILPIKAINPNRFASELKVALYQGVPSKYFVATMMMKQAVNSSLKDQAVDVLYTFLLGNFDRARVLTRLFDNCRYFDCSTKSFVRKLFGAVALKTAIRLYENENFAGTAELFTILEQKKLKLNIFVLLATLEGKMTELDLATMYCSVKVDAANREHLTKIFLTRCADPVISAGSACPPAVMKLIAKMFRVFTSGLLVEETLELFKGIASRQRSLVSPFNIVQFFEPTLRCAFNRLCDDEIRKASFLLYIDVVDSGTPVTFQKVTHRSMFLIAVMLITHASQEFEVKGHINIIHPVIKKMLVTCIKEGVYFDLRTSSITIYSSMTAKEIEVYVLWWFFLYVRARKRRGCDYFNPITVRILQDCIQDNTHLPLHPSLRNVSVSITDCAERVTSVIKNAIAEPIAIITGRERGVFELHPATVRAMSQTACNIMLQHGYITTETDRMCTFCFDKLNVQLAEKLP